MSKIHHTAIIEAGAQIYETVEVGAYAIIGAHVVVGPNTVVGSHTIIEGHTSIGAENQIGHYASIGARPQDMKYRGEPTRLEIGDRNVIREFVTIHTGTIQDQGVTKVGNDNWIMAYVHIGHDCIVGNHVVLSSNAQMAGHVVIGDWVIIGGMSGLHQFVRVGSHAMLGGASALVQDIPPFVIAAGNKAVPYGVNVEGLRRREFQAEAISALKQAYRFFYREGLSTEQALLKLCDLSVHVGEAAAAHVRLFTQFIESSKKGVIRA